MMMMIMMMMIEKVCMKLNRINTMNIYLKQLKTMVDKTSQQVKLGNES